MILNMNQSNRIEEVKASVKQASEGLLKTFSFVPDDKLTWSPSDSSRSALWIVGHCAEANRAFARGIRGESFPSMSMEEFGQMVWNAGRDTKSRAEAVTLLQESTQEIVAALDGLTSEKMSAVVQSPFGPIPVAVWMTFADGHMMGHACQIEYLQTIWGDQQSHMMG
ncbi:DinB family protein [bacterium]|nr:MAG: DinB family protein [bacterium]